MKIKYFTESAYNELFDSIEHNLTCYQGNTNNWICSEFDGRQFFKESRIDAHLPMISNKDDELTNVIKIHSALRGKLTPNQASNPYLWAYLTHVEYWDYTTDRWKSESASIDKIKARFFCSSNDGSSRVGFLRNSISRLWWIGELTFQEDKGYELTELLLSNSDLCVSIIERNFSMSSNVIKGILKAIKNINEDPKLRDVGFVKDSSQYEWRELCKYINRYGAVTLLDVLDEETIEKLSYDYILSLR